MTILEDVSLAQYTTLGVGGPARWFVEAASEDDVVEATMRCVSAPAQESVAVNVGSGVPVTVDEVVKRTIAYFSSGSTVKVTGAFREGDIRHNCADIGKLRATLGFEPSWRFEDGLHSFLDWASGQRLEERSYEKSLAEMRAKGLMHG